MTTIYNIRERLLETPESVMRLLVPAESARSRVPLAERGPANQMNLKVATVVDDPLQSVADAF
jgi:hypothetical protein